jgi:LCP family protein required for cell wall assembly
MMAHKTLLICIVFCFLITPTVIAQVPTPDPVVIPDPVSLIDTGEDDLLNILLLGSDTSNPQNSGRTDVIMMVSINRTHNSIAMLSVPRDLYVYIPGWQMGRINTAYGHGEDVETGGGARLLMETLRYHLGLEIDYYARVDFDDFKQIIDSVGGVEIAVDCGIEDWRLREPDLDPADEANWEMFTLPVGVHTMDGNLALWYVRSRRTSSDFDRGRRQQAMLRGLWRHVRTLGLMNQISEVWPQVVEIVETDIPLTEILTLIPVAANLEASQVASFTFQSGQDTVDWRSPEGSSVLLPVRDNTESLMSLFVTAPTASQIRIDQPVVRVLNASGDADLAQVAADRLRWEGFAAFVDD